MTPLEMQLASQKFQQDARDAEAAKALMRAAIDKSYAIELARENKQDYEVAIGPNSPSLMHLLNINSGVEPSNMRIIGIPVVLDWNIEDWEIRKRAPPPHTESEAMTPEKRAFAVIGELAPLTRRDEWWTDPLGLPNEIIATAIRAARLEALEEAATVFKELRLIARNQQVYHKEIPAVQAEMLAEQDKQQFLAAIRERAKE